MTFDVERFEERAAIMEFDGGLSRFEAETLAASAQGLTRWQAMEAVNAHSKRNTAGGGDNRAPAARQSANNLPGVQSRPEKEKRPMPERVISAGRHSVALLALFLCWGGMV